MTGWGSIWLVVRDRLWTWLSTAGLKNLWARFGVTGTRDPVVHYRVTEPGSDYTSFWVSD